MRRSRALAAACALTGTAALAAVVAAPPAFADNGPVGPTGSAYAVSVHTTLLDKPLVKIDPLPTATYPEGGDESVITVGPDLAGLVTAKVLNASSNVENDVLTSEASIADIVVKHVLKAKVITARCQSGKDGVTGKSSIAELTVLGQRIDVTATADIDVLGVATVKINEQVKDGDTLTVNAVHVTVGGLIKGIKSADIVLSQAKCSADKSGGEPSTPPVPTTTPPDTTPPTSSAPPATTTTTSKGGAQGGIEPGANDEDLAQTGVSAVLPLSLGGLLLIAGGVTAVYLTRRRRAMARD